MRASKVRAVATFELLCTLKRKGYLIATFGMPLILLAYGGVVGGIGYFIDSQPETPRAYAVIDRSGILAGSAPEVRSTLLPEQLLDALRAAGGVPALVEMGSTTLRMSQDEDTVRRQVLDGDLAGYWVVPPDYLDSGRLERYLSDSMRLGTSDARGAIQRLLRDRLLELAVDEALRERVREPVARVDSYTLGPDGEPADRNVAAVIARLAIPIVFVVVLFVALMMSTSYLVQGLAEEKENKVVEVLLASADPDEILTGKLLGLGGAGLLQVTVWFSMTLAGALLFAGMLAGLGVQMPWASMLVAGPFFAVAYLFFGCLMLATGSLGSGYKESQQLTAVWGILAALPLMFLGVMLSQPHGAVARTLTWIPFSAPVTVVIRMALEPDGIAIWEIAGSLAMMVGATFMGLRIGGRLFRLGLLAGSRPKLREILRQARLG